MDDGYTYAWMKTLHIFKPVMKWYGYVYAHVQMETKLKDDFGCIERHGWRIGIVETLKGMLRLSLSLTYHLE